MCAVTANRYVLRMSVAVTLLAGCWTVLFLTGCGASTPINLRPPTGPAIAPKRAPYSGKKSNTFLYVGTLDHLAKNFRVYPIDGSKPVREFKLYWGVASMAIDRWGDIYTTNGFPTGGSITAFTPGGRSILLSWIAYPVNALGFDRLGHLYAAAIGVGEFRPRSDELIRGLDEGVHNPDAVAADAAGNVYIASDSNTSSGLGRGSIEVFPPRGKTLLRKIKVGIHTPFALAFDASGNLYVANCPSCYDEKSKGSVTEYAPGSVTPSRTLTDGINTPVALAIGPNGELFVANNPYVIGKTNYTSVAAYAPTGTKPSLRITDGIKAPVSLAVDNDDGQLYVANRGAGTITVYAPNSTRVLRSIAVKGPQQIAIGKD